MKVNAVTFFGVDEGPTPLGRDLTLADFVEYANLGPATVDELRKRYLEISSDTPRLPIAPAEPRILDKLIWPLRHAKASFMFQNYLGAIALCGMIAEMVAILLFDTSGFQINGQPMTTDQQSEIFGSTFEKLGQDRRVKVLRGYGLIANEQQQFFENIRLARKRYLHLWSQDHESLPSDAIKAYAAAAQLVLFVIGQDFRMEGSC
jgi:hypothetical protein